MSLCFTRMSTHSPEMWRCYIRSIRPTEMTVSDREHQRFLWGAGKDFGFPAKTFPLPALPSAHLCGAYPGWYSLSGCPHRWFGCCTTIFHKTFKSVHFHVRNLPPAITGQRLVWFHLFKWVARLAGLLQSGKPTVGWGHADPCLPFLSQWVPVTHAALGDLGVIFS